MPLRKRSPSGRYSPERIAELEAVLVELHRRQAAQPKAEVERRAVLAVLIGAFERRRDLTLAALESEKRQPATQEA